MYSLDELIRINQKTGVVNLEDHIDGYKDKYGALNVTTAVYLGGDDRRINWEIMSLNKAIDLTLSKAKLVELFTVKQAEEGKFIDQLDSDDYSVVYVGFIFLSHNFRDNLRIALENLSADMDQTDENITNNEFKVTGYNIYIYIYRKRAIFGYHVAY